VFGDGFGNGSGFDGKVGEELAIDRSQVSTGKRKVVCTKRRTGVEGLKLRRGSRQEWGKHPTWIHSVAGIWEM